METNFVVGDIVQSISGHDQNRLFIVVGIDKNGFLAIIDGRYREKSKPKLKNPIHLSYIGSAPEIIERLNTPITNHELNKLIEKFNAMEE